MGERNKWTSLMLPWHLHRVHSSRRNVLCVARHAGCPIMYRPTASSSLSVRSMTAYGISESPRCLDLPRPPTVAPRFAGQCAAAASSGSANPRSVGARRRGPRSYTPAASTAAGRSSNRDILVGWVSGQPLREKLTAVAATALDGAAAPPVMLGMRRGALWF